MKSDAAREVQALVWKEILDELTNKVAFLRTTIAELGYENDIREVY